MSDVREQAWAEGHVDELKPMSILTACGFGAVGVLKKLEPFIMELKTLSLDHRLEKLRETQEGKSCRPSCWLTSVQGGSTWATCMWASKCVSFKVLLLPCVPKARRTTLMQHPNRKPRERGTLGNAVWLSPVDKLQCYYIQFAEENGVLVLCVYMCCFLVQVRISHPLHWDQIMFL